MRLVAGHAAEEVRGAEVEGEGEGLGEEEEEVVASKGRPRQVFISGEKLDKNVQGGRLSWKPKSMRRFLRSRRDGILNVSRGIIVAGVHCHQCMKWARMGRAI
jgi:hypothetical protein